MKDPRDIDKLFNEIIEPHRVNPSASAWNTINNRLDNQQTGIYKRKIYRYRLITAGLTALLISTFYYGFVFHSSEKTARPVNIAPAQNPTALSFTNPPTAGSGINPIQPSNSIVAAPPITSAITNDSGYSQKNNLIRSSEHHGIIAENKFKNQVQENNSSVAETFSSSVSTPSSLSIDKAKISVDHSYQDPEIKPEVLTLLPLTYLSDPEIENMLLTPSALSDEVTPNIQNTCGCTNTGRFSLTGYFAPNISSRFLAPGDKNIYNESASMYNKEEAPDYSFSSGLKFGYVLNNRWSLLTGFNFFTISEKLKPTTIYATQSDNGMTHYSVRTSTGTAELPNKNNNLQIGDSLSISTRSKQTLQYISIPLELKYCLIQKNKFEYYAFAGLSVNFLVGQKTNMDIEDSQGQKHVQTIRSLEGLRRMNLGAIAGFGAQYHFRKQFSLLIEPTFHAAITAINHNTPMKSFPYSVGLALGLVYHFN